MNLQHTKLSNEAMGAIMMCLQKSILEQTDIVPMLLELKFKEASGQLFVLNPPIVKFGVEEVEKRSSQVDFSSMKATDLRAIAKQKNIKGYSRMKKTDLVAVLSAKSV